ncbi:IS3 family transposase [Paenibacillus sp. GbtcB18]
MESFFSHFKTEGLYLYDIRSHDEAQRRISDYIFKIILVRRES